jgi:hypothetical protein
MGDDVIFTEVDYSDWLREWDAVENGERGDALREIVREMHDLDDVAREFGVDLDDDDG